LDRGEGDKNAMVAPQMPAGGLIGQAILHNEAHGQGNDAMGVMGLGQGVVGHVGVEMLPTAGATMLGVHKVDVTWPTGHQVANVMQNSLARSAAKAGLATKGTRAMREVPGAANDLGFGKIFGSGDPFRGIRQVPSGSGHGKALLGQVFQPRNLQNLPVSVMANCLF
jgi:hypothetical protein